MHDLALLLTDHSLLHDRVGNVVALVRDLAVAGAESDELYEQAVRRTEQLRAELVEHFDFEQNSAFPRLRFVRASWEPKLREFESQHGEVIQAFEDFRAELALLPTGRHTSNVLSAAMVFQEEFEVHATAESGFFERHG